MQVDFLGESAANAYSVIPFASTRTVPASVFPVWTAFPGPAAAACAVPSSDPPHAASRSPATSSPADATSRRLALERCVDMRAPVNSGGTGSSLDTSRRCHLFTDEPPRAHVTALLPPLTARYGGCIPRRRAVDDGQGPIKGSGHSMGGDGIDRRRVLRGLGVGAGATVVWSAPSIQSIAYADVVTSAPCPFTLFFQRGNQPAPHRFVDIVRRGEFDCGPRAVATTRLEFEGGARFSEGVMRVSEDDEDLVIYPITVQAMCSTDKPTLGCPARTFQSFEELFQASE